MDLKEVIATADMPASEKLAYNKKIIREKIGKKIRERRKELGMSLKVLAASVGFQSVVAMSMVELGKRSISVQDFLAIARKLRIAPAKLLVSVRECRLGRLERTYKRRKRHVYRSNWYEEDE